MDSLLKKWQTMEKIGSWTYDVKTRQLTSDDFSVRLTKKESGILYCLCQKRGELVSREALLLDVWGKTDYYTGRCMDVYMCKLRKILSRDASITIHSVRGLGYKLTLS